MSTFAEEVRTGKRFEFGKNWSNFLTVLDDERITIAKNSLLEMLQLESLEGRTFLDIGSGSGLFSLAARSLGATVFSLDFDPDSVACTHELKRRYFPGDPEWTITEGSVLNEAFITSLGTFDITYSWGVLHHTGQMWKAADIVTSPVKPDGLLFIFLYLDHGWKSNMWLQIKKMYCSNTAGKFAVLSVCLPYFVLRGLAEDLARFKNPATQYRNYKKNRGMAIYHDWIDWLGGYPFEVAKPQEVVAFYKERGFSLCKVEGGQYVFQRSE